jgi:hypothetical protein
MDVPETGIVLEDVVAVELVAVKNGFVSWGFFLHTHNNYKTYRVNQVAFGSGLAGSAILNIVSDNEVSKLRPSFKALITTSSVRFKPSRWRKPWFARVFIIGHGPRAVTGVSTLRCRCSISIPCIPSLSRAGCHWPGSRFCC